MNPHHTTAALVEMRRLAARLVEDNDDHPDDVAEQACRLARLVLDSQSVFIPPTTLGGLIGAARALVESYRRGAQRGGSIDWSDLDRAHECARESLSHLARFHRGVRRSSRSAPPPARVKRAP